MNRIPAVVAPFPDGDDGAAPGECCRDYRIAGVRGKLYGLLLARREQIKRLASFLDPDDIRALDSRRNPGLFAAAQKLLLRFTRKR